jgi:MFS family permease
MSRLISFLVGRRIGNSPPPRFLKFRSSKGFILTTICLAVFTDIFLYGIIVPVVPFAISDRAHVPEGEVQYWVSVLLSVYGAALLVISPLAGWYADQTTSRREPLLIGLIALTASTVMFCFARSIGILLAARVLQGMSAGVVWTVGQALLVDTVGQKDIGQTMGWVSISMSVGILIAPLLGGVLYEKTGYYSVFYLCFALLALDVLLRLLLVEKKVALQWADVVDVEYLEEGTTAASEHTLGEESHKAAERDVEKTGGRAKNTESSEKRPASSPPASTTTDLPNLEQPTPESQSRWSKLPPVITLLASPRLVSALWGCLVQAALMTSFDTVIPLFTQRVFNWNSIGAGLIFLNIFIPGFSAPLVGWASDKYGPRWLVVTGFLLAVPLWILLRFVTYNSIGQKVLLCALLSLLGVALCIAMTPLMAEITYVVEAKERERPGRYGNTGAYAQAYGLFVTAFAAGTMIGPLWSGMIETRAGWGTMTWTLALLCAAGAVPTLIWTGGLITDDNAKSGEERALGKPLRTVQADETV